jgi:hypothetical protein
MLDAVLVVPLGRDARDVRGGGEGGDGIVLVVQAKAMPTASVGAARATMRGVGDEASPSRPSRRGCGPDADVRGGGEGDVGEVYDRDGVVPIVSWRAMPDGRRGDDHDDGRGARRARLRRPAVSLLAMQATGVLAACKTTGEVLDAGGVITVDP